MGRQNSYKSLIFICTFFTGATGLLFQIVWQKYLSYAVGSEAKSISLVVAVFLLGLATGYRFWGIVTRKIKDRRKLLKFYGWLEFCIGTYAILFPSFFEFVFSKAMGLPNFIWLHFIVSMVFLFIPTFFMGSSIPLLTAVLPENSEEVNRMHSKIYGINTLGALMGVLIGTFVLLPKYGLALSLFLGGGINLIIGILFLANPLKGKLEEEAEIPYIDNQLSNTYIFIFSFAIGAISLSLEILFVRVFNLTIGASYYVFPIVLACFVLGIALGSLSLKVRQFTINKIIALILFSAFYLSLVYLTIPYWPYWFLNIRGSMTLVPSNVFVFCGIFFLFTAFVCLPFLIPLGRLLPIGYSLIRKSNQNFGELCGKLYFYNTLGTVFGAVVVSSVFFHFLNLDQIFKLNIIFLAFIGFCLSVKENKRRLIVVASIFVILAIGIPKWDRSYHYVGLFRDTYIENTSFRGFLPKFKTRNNVKSLYFDDGPNTSVTVAVSESSNMGQDGSLSLIVNGKSDGSVVGDFSTMSLSATIPYIYSKKTKDLKVAVIGLGTGTTAGIISSVRGVSSVDVLEISPKVIAAAPLFDEFTYGLSRNKKANFIELDAFKYFGRKTNEIDIIISEPSNPWVMGVENLYTSEFYHMVYNSLSKEGLYFQWFHNGYAMNKAMIYQILEALRSRFKYVKLFSIGHGDIGVLVSKSGNYHIYEKKIQDKIIQDVHNKLNIENRLEIQALEILSQDSFELLSLLNTRPMHSLEHPQLAIHAYNAFFRKQGVAFNDMLPMDIARWLQYSEERAKVYSDLFQRYKNKNYCTKETEIFWATPICEYFRFVFTNIDYTKDKYFRYRLSRSFGMIKKDLKFLKSLKIKTLKEQNGDLALFYLQELSYEKEWEQALKDVELFIERKVLPKYSKKQIVEKIQKHKEKFRNTLKLLEEAKNG